MGGSAAIEALTGGCRGAEAGGNASMSDWGTWCEGFDPGTFPAACAARGAGGGARKTSGGGSGVSSGASSGGGGGLLRGVVAWEGYVPENVTLPPGTFLSLLSSPYNEKTRAQFDGAAVAPGSCACAAYARLPGSSHYGLTNRGAPARCEFPGMADPKNLTAPLPAAQAAALEGIARLIDDQVRAFALRDRAALARLTALAARLAPPLAAGPAAGGGGVEQAPPLLLLLHPECYRR
jgi:hypothetical protein